MSRRRRAGWRLTAALLVLVACQPAAGSSAPAGGAPPAAPTAAASGAGAPAGPGAGQAPPAPTKLTVSFSQINGNEIPLWVAKEAGIFTQNGLDPDLQLVEGNKGIASLLAGETQFADIGGSQTMSAVASGGDLVVLGVIAPVYQFVFMVAPEIKTAADLKGKTIGVSTLGDSSDIATRLVLSKLGLDPTTDVTIVTTGSSANRRAALVNGAIQAGMSSPPESLLLEDEGFSVLVDMTTLDLATATQAEVGQRSYVSAHPDVTQRYMDSIVEGIARARRDKDFAVGVMKKYFQSSDDRTMGRTYDFYMDRVIPSLPFPKPEQFRESQTILGATNESVRQLDLSQMLDPSFVQSAADRGLDHQG